MRILYNFVGDNTDVKTISEVTEMGLNTDSSLYLIDSNKNDIVSIESITDYQYNDILHKLLNYGYMDLTSFDLHFTYNGIDSNSEDDYNEEN